MFNRWVKIIGLEKFTHLEPHIIYEKRRVCSCHFPVTSFSPGTKTLKHNTMPELMLTPSDSSDSNEIVLSDRDGYNSVVLKPETHSAVGSNSQFIKDDGNSDKLNVSGVEILVDCADLTMRTLSPYHLMCKPLSYSSPCINDSQNLNAIDDFICLLHKIGVYRAKKLTPKCKSLYADALKMQKQLRCECLKRNLFRKRLQAATTYISTKSYDQMTVAAKIFTNLQLRESKNKPKGRRFTLNEKLISLSLYKQSPKSYRLLYKMFVLPSSKTLTNMLSSIPINTGVDPTLIKVLKENVKKLKPIHKFCSILFDEVSLNANLNYNDSEGIIYGFEDDGSTRTQEFADHSLVFMVRGITKNFKQPICYSFCKSTTNKHDLANQIRNVVRAVHSTGLTVISTICDQSTTNTAAINILINETKAFYFQKNKQFSNDFYEILYNDREKAERIKIFHLFDPPHLLKGIRNNLLTKNVVFNVEGERLARWCDIIQLYELDSNIPDVKMLPRLTKEHVIPSEIRKMKVKNAAQVFSQRVSSIMAFLATKNLLSETAGDTAKFCLFFDKLFDSINGNCDKVIDGKIYRSSVKKDSPHHHLWQESLQILSTMRFINPSTNKPLSPQPPTEKLD